MSVPKKFLALLCMAIILLVVGCGSDKSDKPKETKPPPAQTTQQKPPENVPPAANTKVKLFGADLNLTQEEFVIAYNYALDELAKQDGKNYDVYKLDLNNPKQVMQTDAAQTRFYSGQERCAVLLIKNEANLSQLCGLMITPKPGKEFKLSDLTTEMNAAIFAVTGGLLKTSETDGKNVQTAALNFVDGALKSPDESKATSVNSLMIYYNPFMKFFGIIAEDAPNQTPNGDRMVDSLKNFAKRSNFWQE